MTFRALPEITLYSNTRNSTNFMFKGQILRFFDHTVFLLQSAANDVSKHVSISFHKYHSVTCHKSRSNCHADIRPQKRCMAYFP